MLAKGYKTNFNTLLRAAKNGDLLLVEGKIKATGEVVAMLCALHRDGEEFVFVPFGHLCPGDPYETYLPPDPDGGFHGDADGE